MEGYKAIEEVPYQMLAHGFTAEFAREFSRVIDLAAESEDETERAIRLKVEKLLALRIEAEQERALRAGGKKALLPKTPTSQDGIEHYLSQMAILLESASTSDEQLKCSNGLPLVMDNSTKRYKIAPSAATVLRFQLLGSQQPVPKLNLLASPLFQQRTAAAKARMAQGIS